jgi:hypothetical protein
MAGLRIERRQGLVVVVIDLGEVGEVTLREAIEWTKEPPVTAALRQPRKSLVEKALVGRTDRPDADAQAPVRYELAGQGSIRPLRIA